MRYFLLSGIFLALLSGCSDSPQDSQDDRNDETTTAPATTYISHEDITATLFWVGEAASDQNGNISNVASAWDENWTTHYGGVDDPNDRNGYFPAAFRPLQNPFYAALPYNDLDADGLQKSEAASLLPWYDPNVPKTKSQCKNRWIAVSNEAKTKTVYVQWEDAGPFGEDDGAYVFGNARPHNTINESAGIDLSPAARDYLAIATLAKVHWQFVDPQDVPNGPWKEITTQYWYTPALETSFQWQLSGTINTAYDVDVYDVDLFDTPQSTIDALHTRGKKVICYFSAGSYEDWRSDANLFKSEEIGKPLDGWAGESWLDIRSQNVRTIMQKRLDLAAAKHCDGVEPDNIDGYSNDTGFALSAEDQLNYNKFLAYEAHLRDLAIALKNDLDQVAALEPYFDFAVNEQCFEYDECDLLTPFIKAYKPVLNVEYNSRYVNDTAAFSDLCQKSRALGFYTLVLPLDLDDSFRKSCR